LGIPNEKGEVQRVPETITGIALIVGGWEDPAVIMEKGNLREEEEDPPEEYISSMTMELSRKSMTSQKMNRA
jgi:hypothetical protein